MGECTQGRAGTSRVRIDGEPVLVFDEDGAGYIAQAVADRLNQLHASGALTPGHIVSRQRGDHWAVTVGSTDVISFTARFAHIQDFPPEALVLRYVGALREAVSRAAKAELAKKAAAKLAAKSEAPKSVAEKPVLALQESKPAAESPVTEAEEAMPATEKPEAKPEEAKPVLEKIVAKPEVAKPVATKPEAKPAVAKVAAEKPVVKAEVLKPVAEKPAKVELAKAVVAKPVTVPARPTAPAATPVAKAEASQSVAVKPTVKATPARPTVHKPEPQPAAVAHDEATPVVSASKPTITQPKAAEPSRPAAAEAQPTLAATSSVTVEAVAPKAEKQADASFLSAVAHAAAQAGFQAMLFGAAPAPAPVASKHGVVQPTAIAQTETQGASRGLDRSERVPMSPAALVRAVSRGGYAPRGTLIGIASWYGGWFHGRRAADGSRFNQEGFTAAHKTLPFGTVLKVTNLRTQKTTLVKVTDRGPYIPGRMLDLSRAAARAIGMLGSGVGKVKVTVFKKSS